MSTENNYDNNYIIDIHGIQAIKISQLRDINDNSDSNQTHVYSYQYMWDINNSFNYGKYGAYSYDLNDYDEDVSYQQDYQSCYLLLATETNNYKLEYSTVKDDLGIPEINSYIVNISYSIDSLTKDIDNKVNFLNSYHNKFNLSVQSVLENNNMNTDDYIMLISTNNTWNPTYTTNNSAKITPLNSFEHTLLLKFSYKEQNHIAYADLTNNENENINGDITRGLVGHELMNDLINDIKSNNSYFNNRLTWCRLDKNNN